MDWWQIPFYAKFTNVLTVAHSIRHTDRKTQRHKYAEIVRNTSGGNYWITKTTTAEALVCSFQLAEPWNRGVIMPHGLEASEFAAASKPWCGNSWTTFVAPQIKQNMTEPSSILEQIDANRCKWSQFSDIPPRFAISCTLAPSQFLAKTSQENSHGTVSKDPAINRSLCRVVHLEA